MLESQIPIPLLSSSQRRAKVMKITASKCSATTVSSIICVEKGDKKYKIRAITIHFSSWVKFVFSVPSISHNYMKLIVTTFKAPYFVLRGGHVTVSFLDNWCSVPPIRLCHGKLSHFCAVQV
jgi:hypothetical protein